MFKKRNYVDLLVRKLKNININFYAESACWRQLKINHYKTTNYVSINKLQYPQQHIAYLPNTLFRHCWKKHKIYK